MSCPIPIRDDVDKAVLKVEQRDEWTRRTERLGRQIVKGAIGDKARYDALMNGLPQLLVR